MPKADKRRLYVGGLADGVDEAFLQASFIPFGELTMVSIPVDQSTQEHKGFGFVSFALEEDAAAAADNMHQADLLGRSLVVNIAKAQAHDTRKAVWEQADDWLEQQKADADAVLATGAGTANIMAQQKGQHHERVRAQEVAEKIAAAPSGAAAKEVDASHILMTDELKLASLLSQLQAVGDDLKLSLFGKLAAEHSVCPSKAKAGSLGTFERGAMVKEFDDVAFNAAIGSISGPVKTTFGFHLIIVTARR